MRMSAPFLMRESSGYRTALQAFRAHTIDYGGCFDPQNRAPSAPASSYSHVQGINREVAVGYVPSSRSSESAPALASAQTYGHVSATADRAPAKSGRTIDYGAPYDPKNRP
jgi:hypothetical protein